MATLTKKDLDAIFILLATVFMLDCIGSGLAAIGIVIFLVMLILVLYSDNPDSQKYIGNLGTRNNELIVRVSVAIVLIGTLIQGALLIALGFFIGMVLLFSNNPSININVWGLEVVGQRSSSQHSARTK